MSTGTQISKKPRLASNGDRLTNVHDSVVSHILSRLPTKDAIRTSILSKAWEHKWTFSYNVDIDDKYDQNRSEDTFINFMNRIIPSFKHLRSFRLTCWHFVDSSYLQAWISEVLRHKLECFEVNLSANGIVYLCSLLNSTSLRNLSLMQQSCNLHVAATNCVPNLTSLNLSLVKIVNGNPNSSTVTFNFPVLKTFTVTATKWLKVKYVEIHAPSLTTFTSKPLEEFRDYDYSIKIVAPRLTTFSCSYGLPEKIILNGSSIVSASLHSDSASKDPQLRKTVGLRARNLVNGFPNLEELELSSFMAEVSQLGPPLHCHEKLIRLGLLYPVLVEQLFELLHAAPSLKFLTIYLDNLDDYDYGAMEFVPSCIADHLEEVVFRDFDCKFTSYNLANFLFSTAKQLKKFIIVGSYHHRKDIENALSTFPRCSPCLTVDVRKEY